MNTLGIVFLIIAAACFFLAIMTMLENILKVLKSINAKLLNIESTIRKSPEGPYIRVSDKVMFNPNAFINTKLKDL